MAIINKPRKEELAFIAGAPDANKNKEKSKGVKAVTIRISCEVDASLEERSRTLGLTRSKFAEIAIAYCISRKIALSDLFAEADETQN